MACLQNTMIFHIEISLIKDDMGKARHSTIVEVHNGGAITKKTCFSRNSRWNIAESSPNVKKRKKKEKMKKNLTENNMREFHSLSEVSSGLNRKLDNSMTNKFPNAVKNMTLFCKKENGVRIRTFREQLCSKVKCDPYKYQHDTRLLYGELFGKSKMHITFS